MQILALSALSLVAWHAPVAANSFAGPQAGDPRASESVAQVPDPARAEPVREQDGTEPQAGEGTDLGAEQALLDRARAAIARADYTAARQWAAEAIEALLRRGPSRRGDAWPALLERAGLAAWEAQDVLSARRAWERVLEVRSQTLPAEHPELLSARLSVAATLKALGDPRGARALEESVVEVYSRTLPADHADLQVARGNLAGTLHALGDLHGARALQEAVLEVYVRTLPADHPFLQRARSNLAVTITALGDLHAAHTLQEAVLEVYSRILPAEHPHLQVARQNLALTLAELGDLHSARSLLESALEVLSRTLHPEHPDLQAARGNLARTLYALGDLMGARTLFEGVLEVLSRTLPAEDPHLQRVRLSLAATLKALGDPHGARPLEESVLEVYSRTLPPEHPDVQVARGNLAGTLHILGDLHGASSLLEAVLEVDSRTLPAEHPHLRAARENLAATLAALGDLQSARLHFEAVLEVSSRTLPDDHPDLQRVRQNLAVTIAGLAARVSRVAGGDEKRRGERGEGRQRCAELLAAVSRSQARSVRHAILTSSRREAEERAARLGGRLDVCLSFTAGYGDFDPIRELLADAFTLSESTRGAALVSAELARAVAGSSLHERLRSQLRECADELAAMAQRCATSRQLQETVARRDALERELLVSVRDALGGGASLELDPATISSKLGPDRVAVAYRRFVRRDASCGEDAGDAGLAPPLERSAASLCAFVMRFGSSGSEDLEQRLSLVELGPLGPIEDAVSAWRAALGTREGRGLGVETGSVTGSLEERGEALRCLVFDPLRPALGDAGRVLLVLDDVLHLVPFDALPARQEDGAVGGLLGDQYRFELRATLTELLFPPRDESAGCLVALGGAAFDGKPLGPQTQEDPLVAASLPAKGPGAALPGERAWGQGFSPLTHTSLEVRGLSEFYARSVGQREAVVLEGARASRASLVGLAPGARWLHVATHGWHASESIRSWQDPEPLDAYTGLGDRLSGAEQVRGSSPMLLCGLALAGANLPEDALGRAVGLLTAEELSSLDLSSCELAVLSACDTNVGVRRAGQGVASLQRALQMAGARSVITSLWKVPDQATAELMLDFYRRLWVEGKPKHQALWEAKLRLRNAKDERGEPLYTVRDWAAWVLTGDPE